MIAFNHEQIKSNVTGSFLMAKRSKFDSISERITSIEPEVLMEISTKLSKGERFKPTSEEEKKCFALMDDLDHVGGYAKGSLSSKKYMRNEIWSMISFKSSPSWFITLSPADSKHPICLYYADTGKRFHLDVLSSQERDSLILKNPVAAARFFHHMVQMFIKHVLGVDASHPGYYGKTSAYYGTVEQQGRLTLHLHMMIWIDNCLTPQEIRDKLESKDAAFRISLIKYLEGCHQGELSTGSLREVRDRLATEKATREQQKKSGTPKNGGDATVGEPVGAKDMPASDPTLTMPVPPPIEHKECSPSGEPCGRCSELKEWWSFYLQMTDELLVRSNTHTCRTQKEAMTDNQGKTTINTQPKGCLDQNGICRARFPRDIHSETVVEDDGHINLKKMEDMMNTFSIVLTYLCRCNTDVTSLMSGTAIKAVVSYVTDYITKPSLKSYQIFSTAYDIYQKDAAMLTSDNSRAEAARKILMKMTNSITSKMEIGSPMAAMYLLGNPDHYKSHTFVPFWWRSFVAHVSRAEGLEGVDEEDGDRVLLTKVDGGFAPWTNVDDYVYRPVIYNDVSLYDWMQCHEKIKKRLGKARDNNADVSSTAVEDEVEESGSQFIRFLSGHSQYSTHQVKMDLSRKETHVPNFLGGALPRRDQGNFEFYCKTMLTLFKPWRKLTDLKGNREKWEDLFSATRFKPEYAKLMQNFNIRYECLDERDDYHAIMKQKAKQARLGGWGENDDSEDDDDLNELLQSLTDDSDVLAALQTKGSTTKRHERELNDAEHLMNSMNFVKNIAPVAYPMLEYVYNTIKASTWKSVVREAKERVTKDRQRTIPVGTVNTLGSDATVQNPATSEPGDVKILDISYLTRDFKAKKQQEQDMIDSLVDKHTLNEEQEKAFRIVANHISSTDVPPLRMYLGGMGGTGKSQVIKAIKELFEKRKESHRFIILAPTGTAAALLNGSTYHSFLGLRTPDGEEEEEVSMNDVTAMMNAKERLSGVEYIFIDECSMLACKHLYDISARLSQISNCFEEGFGGFNMIFAGDFAQLPPVGSHANLFSNKTHTNLSACVKQKDEAALIGKFLWHQFRTVVILTQNMRQTESGSKEARFRDALINMRYARCTDEDMVFLNSLVSLPNSTRFLSDTNFRNTSIITARNIYKDQFNAIGSTRFAKDVGQELHDFYSIDSLLPVAVPGKRKHRNKKKNSNHQAMTEPIQNTIWGLVPSSSGHFPGKLSLCIGMPVMIRHNDATELCITKGQEGVVVGWNSFIGPYDKPVLDTLYVKLQDPPKSVKFDKLPQDVVPISRRAKNITCLYPDDRKLRVRREQVTVLPNFGMTDYASQGKTREYNVVELSMNQTYHGIYTSLSRGKSAEGTIILGKFDSNSFKITGGIGDDLKREFRELNMLDRITTLQYEGKLHSQVVGDLRYPLIHSYLLHQGDDKVMEGWHSELRTNTVEELIPAKPDDEIANSEWSSHQVIDKLKAELEANKGTAKHVPSPAKINANKATKSDLSSNKVLDRKRKGDAQRLDMKTKKARTDAQGPVRSTAINAPRGIVWDRIDYSCAYDALLVILYDMWMSDPVYWQTVVARHGGMLESVGNMFAEVSKKVYTIEDGRDVIRSQLRQLYPDMFPAGSGGIFISDLVPKIIPETICGNSKVHCSLCGEVPEVRGEITLSHFTVLCSSRNLSRQHGGSYSINEALYVQPSIARSKCTVCGGSLTRKLDMITSPEFLCFGIEDIYIVPGLQIQLPIGYSELMHTYQLRGAIYGGGQHFTSRVIDALGQVWYADGLVNQDKCIFERTMMMNEDTQWLRECKDKRLVYVIYENISMVKEAQRERETSDQ
jgi:hypothetical protein